MSAFEALREVLTGAMLRAAMGMRDVGEAVLARVTNLAGGDAVDTEGDADVLVHYEDSITGYPGVARLFIPGNALWSLPDEGDTAMVLRGGESGGPGAPYLLHGDAGRSIPAWLRSKVGLWHSKPVRIESTGGAVELEASAIKLGANASRGVARLNDTVAPSAGMAAWMAAVESAISTLSSGATTIPPLTDPLGGINSASAKASSE